MRNVTASNARARPYRLVDEVAEGHAPVCITGKRGGAVLARKRER